MTAALLGFADTSNGIATAGPPTIPRFTQPGIFDGDGPNVRSFAVTDYNGDGNNDIAVANINGYLKGHGVPVLLGRGNGSFKRPVITGLPKGESALGVTAADFDGDGTPDLAVSTIDLSDYTLRILIGQGDGSFILGNKLPNARGAVTSGDFNGDGKADVAFVSSKEFTGVIHVALGKGDGTFKKTVVYGPSVDENMPQLVARDVNNDAILDLAYLVGSPVVRLGKPDGTFGPEIYSVDDQHRMLGECFTFDDFNNDGNIDIAMGDATGGHVIIATGEGNGHFTFFTRYDDLAYETISIASADFTGDGNIDIVSAADPNFQGIESELVLLRGRGNGQFKGFTRYVTGGYAMTPAYLNHDKQIDLVSTDLFSTGHVFATLNDGHGLFHAPKLFQTAGSFEYQAVNGDVNGDGLSDVVIPVGSGLDAHLNTGHGGFEGGVISGGAGFYSMELTDISGDGKLDMVEGSTGSQNVLVQLGSGDGSFKPAVGYSNGGTGAVLSLSVADVTGDGKADVVTYTSTEVSVLPGKGNGTFKAPLLSGSAGGNERATLVGDVTDDGKPDVVAVIKTGDTDFAKSVVLVNRGKGDGTFSLVQSITLETNASDAEIADLTGTGVASVGVVGSQGTDGGETGLFVLLNTAGTLDGGTRYDNASDDLELADFNDDGSPDAVATCTFNPCQSTGIGMASFVNNGDGTFVGPNAIYTVFGGAGLTVGDFSDDGQPDFVQVIPASHSQYTLYTNTTP